MNSSTQSKDGAASARGYWRGVARSVPRPDILVFAAFFLAGAAASLIGSSLIPHPYFLRDAYDLWFETDLPRIVRVMTERWTDSRATVHPLFAILVFPFAKPLEIAGMEAVLAARLVFAGYAALWAGLLFAMLRTMGCARLDAALFAALGLASAASVFLIGAPETFLLGSITIMLAVTWAALDLRGPRNRLIEACVSAATFGVSVTNWMAGLWSAVLRRPLREAVLISIGALVIATGVWLIQKPLFPLSEFFLVQSYVAESGSYRLAPESGGPLKVMASVFAHTIVAPELALVHRPGAGISPIIITQPSWPFSSGLLGDIALLAWLGLLAAGIAAMALAKDRLKLRLLIGGVLAGQAALHVVFGNETFLYALHWTPLLIAVAAFSPTVVPARIVRAAAGVALALVMLHNGLQLRAAAAFLESHPPEVPWRADSPEIDARPNDPWSGEPQVSPARVVGAREFDTPSYEPGGSLWPAHDTFNVGVWVLAPDGAVIATSHEPPSGAGFEAVATEEGGLRIAAQTPDYGVTWRSAETRVWRLDLDVPEDAAGDVYLAVRGIGQRRSRVFTVTREDAGVLINERWRLRSVDGADALPPAALGVEGGPGWMTASAGSDAGESRDGWAYARIGPFEAGEHALVLEDLARTGTVDIPVGAIDYATGLRLRW